MTEDDLYGLDPGEFVTERDRLAKELKAAGDKEGAARVKALRKPTVTAWALNRTARTSPDDITALVDLSGRLGEAQRVGDQVTLRRLSKERRELVSRLAGEAAELVGSGAGSRKDELVATLEAASTDEAAAADLVAGRLTKELTPSGFGSVFGLGDLPEPAPRPGKDVAAEKAKKEAEAAKAEEARLAAARAKADEAWAYVAELEKQLAGARRRAEELDKKAGR